jgi:hypothetical protein
MNKFTQNVVDDLGFYVYRLVDPRSGHTFYVGRGKGNRVFNHVNELSDEFLDKEHDEVSAKLSTIRDIKTNGFEVVHIIQRWGLTEKEAKEVEAALIDAYPGLDNSLRGYDTDRGMITPKEIIEIYDAKEFEFNRKIDKFMIIKIKPEISNSRGTYNATRYSWKINYKKVIHYPLVLSVINGIVREVYKVNKWVQSEIESRYYFEGIVADQENRAKYINKKIPSKFRKKGLASPVLYSDKVE